MNDLTRALQPKSDQLNADDLIGEPKTIKITGVKVTPDIQQPISISYEGDNGKPYKPCKSMGRVMKEIWGADGNKWVGKSVTLFRDNNVTWAGMNAGGIRISHISDITKPYSMPLTASKTTRRTYTVDPLVLQKNILLPEKYLPTEQTRFPISDQDYYAWTDRMDKAYTAIEMQEIGKQIADVSDNYDQASKDKLKVYYKDRLDFIKSQSIEVQNDV